MNDNETEKKDKRRTNYKRGADRERKLVNRFKALNWISFRSAGSHSPIDVFAINIEKKEIRLIQSKLGYLSPKEKKELLDFMNSLTGQYIVIGELDHYEY